MCASPAALIWVSCDILISSNVDGNCMDVYGHRAAASRVTLRWKRMIKVLFFAQVRELVGTDATEVAADFPTVEALRQHLAAQSDRWALALEDGKLLAAVNQTLVSFDHPLTDGDEVAFFPPVTGG